MAKCASCGKKGVCLKLDKLGLCPDCHESLFSKDMSDEISRTVEIGKYDRELCELHLFVTEAQKQKNINAEIKCLHAFLVKYNRIRALMEQKGGLWLDEFCSMWEHCHNSQNADFSIISMLSERLSYLQMHGEEEKALIKKHREATANISQKIKDIIKREPGILQTDLYKHFDEIAKKDVQEKLYFLSKDGKIKRTKQGSTYALTYVVKEQK